MGYVDHDITKYRSPAITLGPRFVQKKPKLGTPGPKYDPGNFNRNGRMTSPACSLKFKRKEKGNPAINYILINAQKFS